jgi:hypothetical protein
LRGKEAAGWARAFGGALFGGRAGWEMAGDLDVMSGCGPGWLVGLSGSEATCGSRMRRRGKCVRSCQDAGEKLAMDDRYRLPRICLVFFGQRGLLSLARVN